MDIATIVGLLGAFGFIVMAIDDFAAFVDTPSLLIVVAGSIMVVMFRSSLGEFLGAVGVLGKTFKNKLDAPEALIEQIVELATIARKDGMIALEGQEIANPFMSKAVAMLVDGTDGGIIKSSLERDKDMTKLRHDMGAKLFSAWGEIAPAMGMIGTLIGLVLMLGNMADPKAIGPAMAVALLTTMYGAIIANIIFMPMLVKLEGYTVYEVSYRELVVIGLRNIARGESPRNIQDQMVANLPPKLQAKLEAA